MEGDRGGLVTHTKRNFRRKKGRHKKKEQSSHGGGEMMLRKKRKGAVYGTQTPDGGVKTTFKKKRE